MDYFVLFINRDADLSAFTSLSGLNQGDRIYINGIEELRDAGKTYSFDADQVLESGRCDLVDNWDDVIGGVARTKFPKIKPLDTTLKLFGDN